MIPMRGSGLLRSIRTDGVVYVLGKRTALFANRLRVHYWLYCDLFVANDS